MVRKTKEEAEQTRHLILDTAERVFQTKGVSRTSLSDIAAAAGLTRGAIYWHFRNKADLFTAMCDRITLPLEARRDAAQSRIEQDPVAHVRELALLALVRVVDDEHARTVCDIMLHKCEFLDDMNAVLQRKNECTQTFVTHLTQVFELLRQRGALRAGVEPAVAAIGLHALIGGLMSSWLRDTTYFDLAAQAPVLIDQYLHGVLQLSPGSSSAA